MTLRRYGYSDGPYRVQNWPVANTGSITKDTMVVLDAIGTATNAGYLKTLATATNIVLGVALEDVAAPTTDGDYSCLVCQALPQTIFYFKASGTVDDGMRGATCDVTDSATINIAANAVANVEIVDVDIANTAVYVRFIHQTTRTITA